MQDIKHNVNQSKFKVEKFKNLLKIASKVKQEKKDVEKKEENFLPLHKPMEQVAKNGEESKKVLEQKVAYIDICIIVRSKNHGGMILH